MGFRGLCDDNGEWSDCEAVRVGDGVGESGVFEEGNGESGRSGGGACDGGEKERELGEHTDELDAKCITGRRNFLIVSGSLISCWQNMAVTTLQ